MKKLIPVVVLSLLMMNAYAQSAKFAGAMKTNITAIDTAFANPASLLALSNNFERIGNAEKNQWLPYYYAALTEVNYGFVQKDMSGLDPIADRAEAYALKADSLMPGNSEISCLKSMIATLRMLVDPMARYMEYGPIIEKDLEAAKQQDATNPRPYYLKGQNLKNTPEKFGGGCGPASELLKTASEKFSSFKPASDISPNWGAQRTEKLLSECK